MASIDSLNSDIRVPLPLDNIYKDECCFTFNSADSNDGLYVCLHTFLGFSKQFATVYNSITGLSLFLNIKRIKKPIEQDSEDTSQSPTGKKPKRLAIGIEGGFTPDDEKFEYHFIHTIVVLPEFKEISLEEAKKSSSMLEESVNVILTRESAAKTEIIAWDGEIRPVSQHANDLVQLDNGVKIPPSGWKCEDCDLCTNLWLNLTDGAIKCGRRYYDGSGGNNHGLEHYKKTGYPLAVKLGTITPSGADVYSYQEDQMVEDPKLSEHLSHFNINMMSMEKTEQTITEMEIDLNEKVGSEWDLIQEAGKKLKQLSGPGLTGLQNMGNTCYMNSIMQILYSIPDFQSRYSDSDRCLNLFRTHIESLGIPKVRVASKQLTADIRHRIQDMMADFTLQMCKLGFALESRGTDDQSLTDDKKPEEHMIPRPRALKRIVGKGHPEFSSIRQQDAHEYLLHLFSVMEKNQHVSGMGNPSDAFKFIIEDRLECMQSGGVNYTTRSEFALSLQVSLEDATNPDELKEYEKLKEMNKRDVSVKLGEIVRAKIPFQSCIRRWLNDEVVTDFWSPATKTRGIAKKRLRFSSFPDYLVIHLKKFTADENWIPRKLDVSMLMPDKIDLSEYRGVGILKNEVQLPEGDPPSSNKPEVKINEDDVTMMTNMGFPAQKCREALIATNNGGLEAAMNWILENGSTTGGTSSNQQQQPQVDESNIESLMCMGFSRQQSIKALTETNGNVERAIDWLFSHPDDDATSSGDTGASPSNATTANNVPTDGIGKYQLFGFVSHMGSSTMCGHYVCHILKDERWVIYNDEKVAESVEPPKDLGYIYFYKRCSV